jgi:lipopolysaccharide/colanic/teichoic acid biosynthesis glycosyltransferase
VDLCPAGDARFHGMANGWRGNTSLRKRIQHDLYYITHWNPWFDIKIMWLTLWHGLVHRNAY